jgi:membrane protein YdbS with pleckstrin-like domain
MANDLFTGFSDRSDEELLHLASARRSLTTEAAASLDVELRRRNLTESDRLEYQRSVKRAEQLEARQHRRKPLDPLKKQLTWLDLLCLLPAIVLILIADVALSGRYHIRSEWANAAAFAIIVMLFIVVGTKRIFWQKLSFWLSLLISSAICLSIFHFWLQRSPNPPYGAGRGVAVFGLFLFLGIYKLGEFLRKSFHAGEQHNGS